MKNLLTIASALALVISIAACKKEKQNVINNPTPNTPVPDTTIRLVRMYWEETHWVKGPPPIDLIARSWDFEYDKDGYVSKATNKFEFIENNTHSFDFEWKKDEMVFIRNSAGEIVRVDNTYTSNVQQYTYSWNYFYNGNNEMVKLVNSVNPGITREFEWTHGKLTLIKEQNGTTRTITYDGNGNVADMRSAHLINEGKDTVVYIDRTGVQYDGNPNYVNSVKGLDFPYLIFGYNPQTFSKNNVTGYFVPRGANDSLVFEPLSLEYNHDGYISKDVGAGITYTYEKVIQ